MTRKRTLTREERALWRSVTKHDKKLKPEAEEAEAEEAEPVSEPVSVTAHTLPVLPPKRKAAVLPPLAAGDYAGVDGAAAERMRKGKWRLSRTIDLHGHTQEEAYVMLEAAVLKAYASGQRMLLVITGKGLRGEGAGVLKRSLPTWLNAPTIRPHVLAFDTASVKHGGTGAYYVLIRRKREVAHA